MDFLLHAATVVRGGKAYVFTGRSGAGKSTVASLSPAGTVLTDEISLLRFEDGEWRAYGTPFWGEFRAAGSNSSAPIRGLFRSCRRRRIARHRFAPGDASRSTSQRALFLRESRPIVGFWKSSAMPRIPSPATSWRSAKIPRSGRSFPNEQQPSVLWQKNPALAWREIDEATVIISPNDSVMHELNDTEAFSGKHRWA